MRRGGLLWLVLAACSPTVGGHSIDGAVGDSPVDAPDTSHRGIVQSVYDAGNNTTSYNAGFYLVPGGKDCVWSYVGACSLVVCDSAELSAVSAGVITFTVGAGSMTLTPDGMHKYTASVSPPLAPPNTSLRASAAGADVPAFVSTSLVMPQPLQVVGPADMATISRAQPLIVSWNATVGNVYVSTYQGAAAGGAYPNDSARTIRCESPAQAGSLVIPAELLGQFAPAIADLSIGAIAADRELFGAYDVTVRAVVIDKARTVTLQ